MAMVINSNIMSMNAQRNLNTAQAEQNQAMERLTSGKRINSAADDAAGLAIANKMTSQITGLNQAVRNANDGISMIQTAEGALDESTNILQRMRELSVQSANGTYTEGNRNTLNAELKQLTEELDRIAETTTFNGQKVLDGSQGKLEIQVGSESNQTISMEIGAMDSKSLGLGSTSADVAGTHLAQALGSTTIDDGDVLINGQNIGAFDGASQTFDDLIDQINTNVNGVTASGFNTVEATSVGDGVTTAAAELTIDITDTDGSTTQYVIQDTNNMDELVAAINDKTGGKVAAELNDDGQLVLSNDTGATIALSSGGTLSDITGNITATSHGQIALSSDDGSDITVEAGVSGTATDLANLGFQESRADGTVVGGALNNTALAYGELTINGTVIDHENTDTLQGKVDNINAASGDTGVIASLKAETDGTADLTKTSTELTSTAYPPAGGVTIAIGDQININGTEITFTGTDMATIVADINGSTGDTGVTARADENNQLHLYSEGNITMFQGTTNGSTFGTDFGLGASIGASAAASTTTAATTIQNNDTIKINDNEVVLTDVSSMDAIISDINGAQSTTGVFASVNDQGELVLSSNAAFTIAEGDVNGSKVLNSLGLSAGNNQAGLELKSLSGNPISIELSGSGAANTGLIEQNASTGGAGFGSSISSIDISSASSAQKAIDVIDNALDTINETRGNLGAVNNRLDFTINNLSSVAENASAARSRIEDADFAQESANLSRAQVLQQAGTSMLAQANSAPQQVLSLLQ
ncbi:flagellin N-terminal helical domain-containing protein [Marinobacterium arenosum]|uniref:flagellin N-terminal helical domain-containing protein n=1 Tax=Marinobacterium arenosum TaxID=2862496 RepID=UPI001C9699AD|nr:flagellin [Marinobacterium arenosum]MBY4675930.1 flagellin [Marinobacterium arenosum]